MATGTVLDLEIAEAVEKTSTTGRKNQKTKGTAFAEEVVRKLREDDMSERVIDIWSTGNVLHPNSTNVYFPPIVNKNYTMDNRSISTVIENKDDNKCIMWLNMLNLMIADEILEMGENYQFFDFLDNIRNQNEYCLFLQTVRARKVHNLCNAVLLFLAQKDFNALYEGEEIFVVEMMKVQDDCVQEFALNALLLWDNTTQIETLRNIRLSASYLQKELNEFLGDR